MLDWLDWKLRLAALPGVVVGWFLSIAFAFPTLFMLMVLDFATGILASISRGRKVISVRMRQGFIGKVQAMLLVYAAYWLSGLYPVRIPIGSLGELALSDAIAGAFCLSEFFSIVENVGLSGVKLGPVMRMILAKYSEQFQEAQKEAQQKDEGNRKAVARRRTRPQRP